MTTLERANFRRIEPALEIANIRVAADLYEAEAIKHQREAIRLNRLVRHAREMADNLEAMTNA